MIMKAKCIMVQGTASSVGKSLIAAGLCRIFKQDGYRVAPFKSQNMALNSYITTEGHEMGRAQVVQAEAAGIRPHVSMNPILLKPTTDKKAQVIINGKVYGNMSAVEYHDFKPQLAEMVKNVYTELAGQNDIVVIEGAGSPAEINLRDRDIVNMGMAEIADAPVILVGDIDKGGVFASLAGTMLLLSEAERARVKGVIINKFRGDIKILEPGIKMIEDIIKVPVIGVIPYTKLNIDDEDSVTDKFSNKKEQNEFNIDIAIIKLPHISNFTDFNALENIEGVRVRYVDDSEQLGLPDMVIIPGTKNTIEDLMMIKKSGIENAILMLHNKGVPIFGICGGYQMLGTEVCDPYQVESTGNKVKGIGLLDAVTVLQKEKTTTQVRGTLTDNTGILDGIGNAAISGYEIHMGTTELMERCIPFAVVGKPEGKNDYTIGGVRNAEGNVFGTYIHGIFDSNDFTIGIINNLRKKKGLRPLEDKKSSFNEFKQEQYDQLADVIRENVDMDRIYKIMNTWRP